MSRSRSPLAELTASYEKNPSRHTTPQLGLRRKSTFLKKQRYDNPVDEHQHQMRMRIVSERMLGTEQTHSGRAELAQVESLKAFYLAEAQRIRERAQKCVAAMLRDNPKAMIPSSSFLSIPRDSSEFRSQLLSTD